MARHLQSHAFTKKRRIQMWLKSIVGIFIVICVTYFVSWCMHSSFLMIEDVQVFGADQDITDSIRTLALNDLTANYIGILPRANSLIYPRQQIVSDITANFIQVLDVHVDRDGMRHLRISVNEKTPSAVVCTVLPDFDDNQVLTNISNTDSCYFADDSGLLFEKSSLNSNHVYPVYYAPTVVSLGTTTDFVGTHATSTDEFVMLQKAYKNVQTIGMPVDAMLIKDAGEYELYSSSTVIYFDDTAHVPDEIANLIAFLGRIISEDRTQKKSTVFDYIDLRYGSNVFYKIIK